MAEQTDQRIELTDHTIELCYNSSFGELINQVSKEHDLLTFKDKSSIPIPTKKLEQGNIALDIGQQVKDATNAYTEIINEPKSALEFPFLITGKKNGSNNITNLAMLYDDSKNLNNNIVKMSNYSKELYKEVVNANKQSRDIYILGHTHPKPSEESKSGLLTEKLSLEIKQKYGIKELGLNLSLQDLYQLVYFEQALQGTVKKGSLIMICIAMFDGSVTYIYVEDGKFKKAKIQQQKEE